jgi:hypothetical protein
LVALQELPQRPQAPTLVRVSTSQPLVGLPSQSAKPGLQARTAQRPEPQVAVALARRHALPQAPQWETLLARVVSQPLAEEPSQSPRPGPQSVRSHTPALQRAPAPSKRQTVTQAPQWSALVRVSVSQPLPGSPSQLAKPGLQLPTPQTPAAQAPVALGGAQGVEHDPQRAALVRVSVSQPLAGLPSQSASPSPQRDAQEPMVHEAAAPEAAVQRVSQVPQWSRSPWRSVSQPLAAMPSQSP